MTVTTMIKLHAVYRRTDKGLWDATIALHPYILVEHAQDIESAKELLTLYTAEEFGKTRWEITKETIL